MSSIHQCNIFTNVVGHMKITIQIYFGYGKLGSRIPHIQNSHEKNQPNWNWTPPS